MEGRRGSELVWMGGGEGGGGEVSGCGCERVWMGGGRGE